MNEKRQHYRTDCRVTACVEQANIINDDKFCQTANIGMKGAFVSNAPRYSVGTMCNLEIKDKANDSLKIKARVSHVTSEGVGFTFIQPNMETCLRLRHLVKPHWDRRDPLEGMMLMLRYSKPATDLKDALTMLTILENNNGIFTRLPHTVDQCQLGG